MKCPGIKNETPRHGNTGFNIEDAQTHKKNVCPGTNSLVHHNRGQ
jgi:hypothetical protein